VTRPIIPAFLDDPDMAIALYSLRDGVRIPLDAAARLLARGIDVTALERRYGV
jgi:hypothetical protein